jgi:hypothetical protein
VAASPKNTAPAGHPYGRRAASGCDRADERPMRSVVVVKRVGAQGLGGGGCVAQPVQGAGEFHAAARRHALTQERFECRLGKIGKVRAGQLARGGAGRFDHNIHGESPQSSVVSEGAMIPCPVHTGLVNSSAQSH